MRYGPIFYEPRRKIDNKIWVLTHAKRPSIAKRTLTAKKVLYAVFFRNSWPLMQIAGVSGSFYKNVVLKKMRTKMRKVRPKPVISMTICYMTMVQSINPQLWQCLKSKKLNVLSHPPYSQDLAPCDFFLFPQLKKNNTYLIGDIGPEVHWCLQFTSFL